MFMSKLSLIARLQEPESESEAVQQLDDGAMVVMHQLVHCSLVVLF